MCYIPNITRPTVTNLNRVVTYFNRPWDQTNLVLNSMKKWNLVFYFRYCVCFLNRTGQNFDLIAFTSKNSGILQTSDVFLTSAKNCKNDNFCTVQFQIIVHPPRPQTINFWIFFGSPFLIWTQCSIRKTVSSLVQTVLISYQF